MKKSVLIALIIIGVFLVAFGFKNLSNFTGGVVQGNCVDSDGNDTFNKGNITVTNFVGTSRVINDSCGNTARLFEKRCDKLGHAITTTYTCPNKCFDGACVRNNSIKQ